MADTKRLILYTLRSESLNGTVTIVLLLTLLEVIALMAYIQSLVLVLLDVRAFHGSNN